VTVQVLAAVAVAALAVLAWELGSRAVEREWGKLWR
jgi:hypothetical protein